MISSRSFKPVTLFDGKSIPFDDDSFDTVMLIDVLHHTTDPLSLLLEASRIAIKTIIIKDHILEGILAYQTLCFMDWIGNAHHGVALPKNYFTKKQWESKLYEVELRIDYWNEKIKLYPIVVDWLFGRSLHFISRLEHM